MDKKIISYEAAISENSELTDTSSIEAKRSILIDSANGVAIIAHYDDGSDVAMESYQELQDAIRDYAMEDKKAIRGTIYKTSEEKIRKITEGRRIREKGTGAAICQKWIDLKKAELAKKNGTPEPKAFNVLPGMITLGTNLPKKFKLNKEESKKPKKVIKWPVVVAAAAIVVSMVVGLVACSKQNANANANATAETSVSDETDTDMNTVALDTVTSKLTAEEEAFLNQKSASLEMNDKLIEAASNEDIPDDFKDNVMISGEEYTAAHLKYVSFNQGFSTKFDIQNREEFSNKVNSFRMKTLIALTQLNNENKDQFKEMFSNFFTEKEDIEVVNQMLDNLLNKNCTEKEVWDNLQAMVNPDRENQNLKAFADEVALPIYSLSGKISEDYLNSQGWSSHALETNPTEADKKEHDRLKNEGYQFISERWGDPTCERMGLFFDELQERELNTQDEFYVKNKEIDDQHNHPMISYLNDTANKANEILANYALKARNAAYGNTAQVSNSGKTTAQTYSKTVTSTKDLTPQEAAAIAPDQKAAIDNYYAGITAANKQAAIEEANKQGIYNVTENRDELVGQESERKEVTPDGGTHYTVDPSTIPHDSETYTDPNGNTVTESTPAAPTGEGNKWAGKDLGPSNWDYSTESPATPTNPEPAPAPEPEPAPVEPAPQPEPAPENNSAPEVSQGGIIEVEEGDFEPVNNPISLDEAKVMIAQSIVEDMANNPDAYSAPSEMEGPQL